MPTQTKTHSPLLDELNLLGFTREEQDEKIEELLERVNFVITGKIPDNDFDRIDTLLQEGKNEEAAIAIQQAVPNARELAQQIMRDGIDELKKNTTVAAEPDVYKFPFIQPVATVWIAVENVLREAGIEHKGLLNFVTDLVEDYTQDGTRKDSKQTSYNRDFGANLLARMTEQTNVTQATIRNPINTAFLFADDSILKSMKDRIGNSYLSLGHQKEVTEILLKLHKSAKLFIN